MISKIGLYPLDHEGMLLEQFRENIGVEEDGRLGH